MDHAQTRLDASDLLAEAARRAGLSDFGPEDFREGFHVLTQGLENSTSVREDRREALRERLLNILVNRAWFAKDLADHPEIADEALAPPVFIISLPRTGSTKLHRVLSATGNFQFLTLWSVSRFARIPGMADGGRAQRIEQTRAFEAWMYEVSPDILKWHPLHTEEADEDCLLMESSFRNATNYGTTAVGEFMDWLMKADVRPAFDYFRSQIQYLQWQSPGERHKPWLFKNPDHMGSEARLTDLFPNAKFIVTHRDPAKVVPSITHTMAAFRKLYLGRDTSAEVATGMLEGFAAMTARHIGWREAHPEIQVLDLSFSETTRDGIGTVRKVHEFLGIEVTEAALAGARAWEARNPREKHGRTSYSADEVGRNDAEIHAKFAHYIANFADFLE